MARLKLSPPWILFYREVEEMFKFDPSVHVIWDEENYDIQVCVEDSEVYSALYRLLVYEKTFGTITVHVNVISATGVEAVPLTDNLYAVAFKNNPALSYVRTVYGVFDDPLRYVVFRNQVVQYFTDDLGDINGLRSTLYQEIAKDIFKETDWVFYCTDVKDGIADKLLPKTDLGMPLSEWP